MGMCSLLSHRAGPIALWGPAPVTGVGTPPSVLPDSIGGTDGGSAHGNKRSVCRFRAAGTPSVCYDRVACGSGEGQIDPRMSCPRMPSPSPDPLSPRMPCPRVPFGRVPFLSGEPLSPIPSDYPLRSCGHPRRCGMSRRCSTYRTRPEIPPRLHIDGRVWASRRVCTLTVASGRAAASATSGQPRSASHTRPPLVDTEPVPTVGQHPADGGSAPSRGPLLVCIRLRAHAGPHPADDQCWSASGRRPVLVSGEARATIGQWSAATTAPVGNQAQ
ncbi:hypothetical protein SDC9_68879 [bioreactor metagenome]|uniref:Uncharacterized protein n=1 Tax=bioreactor metagenome TaxID=1076179 RepID=A0A644Y8H7_9ZZZZ